MASVAASSLVGCAPEELTLGPSGERADSGERCPDFAEPVTVGRVDEAEILEASGLALSRINPGILWTHNDGDFNNLKLHAIDREGVLRAELKVDDTQIEDLEDLAIGPGPIEGTDYLYLADTGDNELDRDEVAIIRIPEPSIALDDDGEIELSETAATTLLFRYDDDRSHDAEALLVDPRNGDLWVFTKRFDDDKKTLAFRARPPFSETGFNLFEEVRSLRGNDDLDGRVVAADISADGSRVALAFKERRTRMWTLMGSEGLAVALDRRACRAPRAKGQQEAIALSSDGTGFYMLPEGSRPELSFVAELAPCHRFRAPAPATTLIAADEVSGLAYAQRGQERLWALSDSSPDESRNHLLALGRDGQFEAILDLPGTQNVDWEDIAIGPGPRPGDSYIYIGDVGDNDLEREGIQVYRLPEPGPGETASELHRFDLVYPNGDAHDAEAMVVDPIRGELYIFTRQRADDARTRVYRATLPELPGGPVALEKVLTADEGTALDQTIVAADLSADGLSLALAVKDGAPVVLSRHPEAPLYEGLEQRACELPFEIEDNDSLAFDRDGRSLFYLPEGPDPRLHHIQSDDG